MKIRKSINSARGYFDDEINTQNDIKLLQVVNSFLYDYYYGNRVNGATIMMDKYIDSEGHHYEGVPEMDILIDPHKHGDDRWLIVYAFPDKSRRGRFVGILYGHDGKNELEQFDIPMSGCSQFIINKIDEITSGFNSQGVESSMKIIRNRITANKRRVVKAAVEGNLDVQAIKKQFPAFLDRVDSGLNKAFADDYEYRDFTIRADQYEDEDGVMFDIVLAHGHDYYADAEEVGDVSIECLITNDYPFVVIVNDSDEIQAEGNSFDDIFDTCVGELIRLAEDYENFVIRTDY